MDRHDNTEVQGVADSQTQSCGRGDSTDIFYSAADSAKVGVIRMRDLRSPTSSAPLRPQAWKSRLTDDSHETIKMGKE